MQNIAIITARSGSKGLVHKNIKILNGRPLLAYTIQAALESEMFATVHVSTDSEEYAEIARKYGAEVPFLRSKINSSDEASSWDVVKEVLKNYKKMGKNFETVTLLQPTSPLRDGQDIKEAYDLLIEKKGDAVVSVVEEEHSPLLCNQLPESLSMNGFIKLEANRRRQDLSKYYRINGAIYILNTKMLEKEIQLYKEGCYAYIMSKEKSIDIDSELDFRFAECLMNK